MKKLFALALMLILIPLAIFADPLVEVVDGNIDEFDIINASGIKIADGFTADGDGYLIRVKNEPVEAISPIGNLKLKENTLLAIIETEYSAPVLYLVYGEMSLYPKFEMAEMMSIYTPTSRFKINGEGEFVFISTDDREEFFNYGKLGAEAFNSITGQLFDVSSFQGVNFLSKEGNPFNIGEDIFYSTTNKTIKVFKGPEARIPLAPEFAAEPIRALDRPGAPLMNVVEQTLYKDVPDSPAITISIQELFEEAKTPTITSDFITVQQILIDKPELIEEPIAESIEEILEVKVSIAPEEEEEAVVEEVVVEEEETAAPIKAAAQPNKGFEFDLDFASRAYLDSDGETAISASIIPSFRINSLYLDLNIDPFAILEYEKNMTAEDWVGYGFNFINYLRYRSLNEVFDITISRTLNLPASVSGLYDGYNHADDRYIKKLSSQFHLNTNAVDFTIGAEDLTLGRFNPFYNDNRIYANLTLTASESFKLKLYAGAVANFKNGSFNYTVDVYPEAGIYIPFVDKPSADVGMNITMATIVPAGRRSFNIIENGFMLSGAFPMEFGSFSIEPGVYYTNHGKSPIAGKLMHYKGINSIGYEPEDAGESILTLAARLGYDNGTFGIEASMNGDLMLNSMKFYRNNSLLQAAGYVNLPFAKLSAGMKVQNFTDISLYEENAGVYGAIETTIGGVTTKLSGGFDSIKDKDFYFSFAAKTSFASDKENIKGRGSKLISIDLENGIEYNFDEGISYNIAPMFTFGSSKYAISLRAPFQFRFLEDKTFIIEGYNGNEWWKMGTDAETLEGKIYDATTDAFALVNYIKLGGKDTTRAYFVAERGDSFTDTIFSAYGSKESLNLNAGFNFPNLRFNIFAGDIEAPHLAEVSFAVHPVNLASFSINLTLPGEVYVKDMMNFSMHFYPEIMLQLPIIKNHFTLSAFASGTISASYKNGKLEQSSLKAIYDFGSKDLYSYITGARINIKSSKFSVTAEGGIRNGILKPDMYSAFTALYNEMPSINAVSSPSSYFGKVEAELNTKLVDLALTYSASDLLKLMEDPANADDSLSLKASLNVTDTTSIYANINRRGFLSIFDGSETFQSVVKSADTIYALGLDFDFGKASLNAELASSPIRDAYTIESGYINIGNGYDATKGTATSFSVSTRISF